MKAGKMEVITCTVGPVCTNCYLLVNEDSKETLIIDPGNNVEKIQDKIIREKLKPVAVLLTHGHFDHIMAVKDVEECYSIPVYANQAEQDLLLDESLNLSLDMGGKSFSYDASNYIVDGEVLEIAGFTIKAIATPGHTIGSMCFYFNEEDVLVSGDTLFRGTVGRTDLPTGNMSQIIHSVCVRLKSVDDKAIVLPGHGETSTMGYERMNNPYMSEGML